MDEIPIKYVDKIEEEKIRKIIVEKSISFQGIPFIYNGTTHKGLDCSGCLHLSYNWGGIPLPRTDGSMYKPDWWLFAEWDRYLVILLKYFRETKEYKGGDIITFQTQPNTDVVDHLGIIVDNENFIHARSGRKVELTRLDHRFWHKKIFNYMRYKGFEN